MIYFRTSTYIILLAIIVLSLGFLSAFLAYRTAEDLRYDASIINHAGIIRGSIQRAAKQTLSDTSEFEQSTVDVIDTVDKLMEQFLSDQEGSGNRAVVLECELINKMNELSEEWWDLKAAFAKYRSDPSEELQRQILVRSERCWDLADAGVLTAQYASEEKLAGIGLFYVIVVLGLLNAAFVVWVTYVYVRRRLEQYAAYDATTSVLNRRSYDTDIEREVSRSKRYKRNMSLLIFDIDHFKVVNDTFGHKTGDEVLLEIANLTGHQIREADSLYRLGGDEFVIMLPETTVAQAIEVAEKIRKAIGQYSFSFADQVTISAGVSGLGETMTPDDLFCCADAALYQAKQKGRNVVSRMPTTTDSCT